MGKIFWSNSIWQNLTDAYTMLSRSFPLSREFVVPKWEGWLATVLLAHDVSQTKLSWRSTSKMVAAVMDR